MSGATARSGQTEPEDRAGIVGQLQRTAAAAVLVQLRDEPGELQAEAGAV